jgi:hypothetical protein
MKEVSSSPKLESSKKDKQPQVNVGSVDQLGYLHMHKNDDSSVEKENNYDSEDLISTNQPLNTRNIVNQYKFRCTIKAILIVLVIIVLYRIFRKIEKEEIVEKPNMVDNAEMNETSDKVKKIEKIYKINRTSEEQMILNNLTLASLCDTTIWQPGLYLNCTNLYNLPEHEVGTVNPQGVTNAYNIIVTCLRWAIDGGMGFVMPRIAIRSKDNIVDFKEWADLGFFFDEDYMRSILHQQCPQLNIVNTYFNITKIVYAERIGLTEYTNGEYRKHAIELLQKNDLDPKLQSVVIWENEPLFNWVFNEDAPKVSLALHNTIIPNPLLRSLSSSLKALLPVDYIGIHLRAEADMIVGSYTDQVNFFLLNYQTKLANIDTIYVAVGSKEIEDQFRREMKFHNFKVISKWSLAENTTLIDTMNSLGFDQLGLIDFHILFGSSHFFGCGMSSFAYAIAQKRGNGRIEDCRCHIYGEIFPPLECCF